MASSSVFKGRLGLIMLAVLFLGPMFAAYFSYFGGWRPGGQVQQGNLIDTVSLPQMAVYDSVGRPLEDDMLHGPRWTMLYVGTSHCEDACRKTLYNMRQVWKSLHRKSKRVQGLYVITDRDQQTLLEAYLQEEHQGLHFAYANADASKNALAEWQQILHAEGRAPQGDNVYLIDPMGNWMLYYTDKDSPKGMLKDIKKLLRLSNIG